MTDPGPGRIEVEVPASLDGMRVDRVVALVADLPRSTVGDLVAGGKVRIDGVPVTVRSRPVVAGQELSVDLPDRSDGDRPSPDPSVSFTSTSTPFPTTTPRRPWPSGLRPATRRLARR